MSDGNLEFTPEEKKTLDQLSAIEEQVEAMRDKIYETAHARLQRKRLK